MSHSITRNTSVAFSSKGLRAAAPKHRPLVWRISMRRVSSL